MLQGVVQPDQQEGPVAKAIEKQTAKLPSDFFLWAALGAMGVSLVMQMRKGERAPAAQFVGEWVPTLLLLGVYNKIVKVAGSDKYDQQNPRFGEQTQSFGGEGYRTGD